MHLNIVLAKERKPFVTDENNMRLSDETCGAFVSTVQGVSACNRIDIKNKNELLTR